MKVFGLQTDFCGNLMPARLFRIGSLVNKKRTSWLARVRVFRNGFGCVNAGVLSLFKGNGATQRVVRFSAG